MSEGFLASEYRPAEAGRAMFWVIPAPLERSVSWGAGIYTHAPIDCSGSAQEVLARIQNVVEEALKAGAVPVLLGGEHTATLGALRALKAAGRDFGVVQFDAHADLRNQYQGDSFSHASVMRRAVLDLGLPLAQFAVREISKEEIEARKIYNVTHYDSLFLSRVGLPEKPLPEDFPKDIYLSFDVDAFDPSLMPGKKRISFWSGLRPRPESLAATSWSWPRFRPCIMPTSQRRNWPICSWGWPGRKGRAKKFNKMKSCLRMENFVLSQGR